MTAKIVAHADVEPGNIISIGRYVGTGQSDGGPPFEKASDKLFLCTGVLGDYLVVTPLDGPHLYFSQQHYLVNNSMDDWAVEMPSQRAALEKSLENCQKEREQAQAELAGAISERDKARARSADGAAELLQLRRTLAALETAGESDRAKAALEIARLNAEILQISDRCAALQRDHSGCLAEIGELRDANAALQAQVQAAGVGADLGTLSILDPLRALAADHVIVAMNDLPADLADPITIGVQQWPSLEALVRDLWSGRRIAFTRCDVLATAMIDESGQVFIRYENTGGPDLGVAL